MSLNDSLLEDERAKLAVWDYPVSDRYTKIAAQMSESDKPSKNDLFFKPDRLILPDLMAIRTIS